MAGLAALCAAAFQSSASAGSPGRGRFGGSSTYVCKSGKQVQYKKAYKEFGGRFKEERPPRLAASSNYLPKPYLDARALRPNAALNIVVRDAATSGLLANESERGSVLTAAARDAMY